MTDECRPCMNQEVTWPVTACAFVTCDCHGQVEGQEPLIPDPRTTTEVVF